MLRTLCQEAEREELRQLKGLSEQASAGKWEILEASLTIFSTFFTVFFNCFRLRRWVEIRGSVRWCFRSGLCFWELCKRCPGMGSGSALPYLCACLRQPGSWQWLQNTGATAEGLSLSISPKFTSPVFTKLFFPILSCLLSSGVVVT